MIEPSYEEHAEKFRPLFGEAVERRDANIKLAEAAGRKIECMEDPGQDYFAEKRDRLVRFLRAGARAKGIRCSL